MRKKLTSPLKWKRISNDMASTILPFGFYSVRRDSGPDGRPAKTFIVDWCFEEYYDEGHEKVASLAAGKEWAQKDWDERVRPILLAARRAGAI